MNAKKAKAARHLARRLSIGMKPRQLNEEIIHMKKRGIDPETKQPKIYEWDAVTFVNSPETTSGIYRQIKRFLRQGLSLTQIERSA